MEKVSPSRRRTPFWSSRKFMATASSNEAVREADEQIKPPFLRRVRIQGYKSIAFCDVPLQPLTILVGRNAAGKSNFLDALAFLRDVMVLGVRSSVKSRGGWESLLCRSSLGQETITVAIESNLRLGCQDMAPSTEAKRPQRAEATDAEGQDFRADYTLEIGPSTAASGEDIRIIREVLIIRGPSAADYFGCEFEMGGLRWASPKNNEVLLRQLSFLSCFSKEHRGSRPILGLLDQQLPSELLNGLSDMGFYNFRPDEIRELQIPSQADSLHPDGSNLASVLTHLKRAHPDSYLRLKEYLSIIAENIEDVDSVRYGTYETVKFRTRPIESRPPLDFDAASMSDGTLRALAALVAAFQAQRPSGPSVVGIEEPEAALHPAAVRVLVDALQEATQRTQILLTTHSADLLADRDLDPAQVLVVRNRDGQTQITPVDPASREIIHKELYSLADLQRMDQLELDEADLERQARESRANGKE